MAAAASNADAGVSTIALRERCSGELKSDISSHDTQIIQFWSFCDRTQTSNTGVSAYIRRLILILTKFAYFGVSADVRRKTPRHYYGFTHIRTLKGFGVSADMRRYSSCLNSFKYHKCVHHTQIIQYRSFCDRTQTLRIWMKYYLLFLTFFKPTLATYITQTLLFYEPL